MFINGIEYHILLRNIHNNNKNKMINKGIKYLCFASLPCGNNLCPSITISKIIDQFLEN